jgi:hypothetical protein
MGYKGICGVTTRGGTGVSVGSGKVIDGGSGLSDGSGVISPVITGGSAGVSDTLVGVTVGAGAVRVGNGNDVGFGRIEVDSGFGLVTRQAPNTNTPTIVKIITGNKYKLYL